MDNRTHFLKEITDKLSKVGYPTTAPVPAFALAAGLWQKLQASQTGEEEIQEPNSGWSVEAKIRGNYPIEDDKVGDMDGDPVNIFVSIGWPAGGKADFSFVLGTSAP